MITMLTDSARRLARTRSAAFQAAGSAASCRRERGAAQGAARCRPASRLEGGAPSERRLPALRAKSRLPFPFRQACLLGVLALLAGAARAGEFPIVVRPAIQGDSDTVAIMLSGDGGWRRLDILVTNELRKEGVPVVGLLSNTYFAPGRTPEEAAAVLESLIRDFSARWHKPRVLLIGYSRGADVLPFLVNRLSTEARAKVAGVGLLGLEGSIDFKYHPSWIPFYHPHDPEFPVKPEVEKLRGLNVLCVYGALEKTSICPSLDPHAVQILRMPGHHHFAGHYVEIAKALIRVAK
jgi:type IV secretory pathway VirJ component